MTENPADGARTEDDLPEQLRVRRDKRERLLAEGVDPYPVEVRTPPPGKRSVSPGG
jgi:lysyl-tRNA synthetase class 2